MSFNSFISKQSQISVDFVYPYQNFVTFLQYKFDRGIEHYSSHCDVQCTQEIIEQIESFAQTNSLQFLLKSFKQNDRGSSGLDGISVIFSDESFADDFHNSKNKKTFTKYSSVDFRFHFEEMLFCHLNINFNYNSGELQVVYHESQKELAQKIENFFHQFKESKTEKQIIYSLLVKNNSLSFNPLGEIYHQFIPENYSPEVAGDYQFLQDELSKKELNNKLVILSGLPGTGKTHFVRALISALPKTAIVNLDQSVASNFSSSQILSALLKFKQENEFDSILFLIEDADYLILNRSLDNMGPLATLLNASDGILGDIFNLRILATTNAKKIEIEKALLRPGRLLKHLEFGLLSAEQSNQILQRLAQEKNLNLNGFSKFSEPQTLALIYQKAYDLELEQSK